jgi:hypothetical protein
MAAEFHKSPLPAWIVLPFLFAGMVAVLTTWGTGSLLLGLGIACVGAASAAWWCERTLRAVVSAIAQIAAGDRYAAPPSRVHGGAVAQSFVAAETMRQALIDADALVVDRKSRDAESRLRQANRGFFTQRFRGTIDQLTGTFQSAGEEIRVTTANLGARNKDMSQRTAHAVEAATCASRDVAAVAEASRGLLDLIVPRHPPPRTRPTAPSPISATPIPRCTACRQRLPNKRRAHQAHPHLIWRISARRFSRIGTSTSSLERL